MTKFFNKFKITYFWSILPTVCARIFFPQKNLAPSSTTSYEFLRLCQNLDKKNNDPILRKRQERRTEQPTNRYLYELLYWAKIG